MSAIFYLAMGSAVALLILTLFALAALKAAARADAQSEAIARELQAARRVA